MASALIIVDAQLRLVEDETWWPEPVLDCVCALQAAARAVGTPILYVADSSVIAFS